MLFIFSSEIDVFGKSPINRNCPNRVVVKVDEYEVENACRQDSSQLKKTQEDPFAEIALRLSLLLNKPRSIQGDTLAINFKSYLTLLDTISTYFTDEISSLLTAKDNYYQIKDSITFQSKQQLRDQIAQKEKAFECTKESNQIIFHPR